MLSSNILLAADKAVSTERQGIYGHPAENFHNIATMWEGYKGVKFTTADVAMMMILVKVARYRNTPGHIDTLVDIAGYVKTEEMILERNLRPVSEISTNNEKLSTETGRFDSNRQNLTPPPRENSL